MGDKWPVSRSPVRPSALGKGWVSRSPQGSSPPITSLVLQRSSSWHSDPHLPRSAPTRECERGAAWGASRGAGRPAGQSVQGRGSFPASLCRSLLPRCCCRRLPGPPGPIRPPSPFPLRPLPGRLQAPFLLRFCCHSLQSLPLEMQAATFWVEAMARSFGHALLQRAQATLGNVPVCSVR